MSEMNGYDAEAVEAWAGREADRHSRLAEMVAFSVVVAGVQCIVRADNRGKAMMLCVYSARDAGYGTMRELFRGARCKRAPEHDAGPWSGQWKAVQP